MITWTSLNISEVCEDIQKAIKSMQIFVKEIRDMKEARVDEVFESISETMLLKLDNYPKQPTQLLSDNIAYGATIASDVEIKSTAAEKAVIIVINKFMDFIVDETVQHIKYNWMDPEKVHKRVSQTKLTKGKYEPGMHTVLSILIIKRLLLMLHMY